jgi:Rab family protein
MSSQQLDPFALKATIVGDGAVGKSSLLHRLRDGVWAPVLAPTIGAAVEHFFFEGPNIRLSLYDTAGQDQYIVMTSVYIRDSRISLVCFQLDSAQTFTNLPKWIERINDLCTPPPVLILVGTKADLVAAPVISADSIHALCEAHHIVDYFETSAKAGLHIAELKDKLESISRAIKNNPPVSGAGKENPLVKQDEKDKNECC